jgi:hypothetical protein
LKATAQKIGWARRAIEEMRAAEARASKDDFQYHFGAFLALIGGLRQFITVKPHKKWVYNMDERDLNYCTCIDLRNIDIHVDNAIGTPRSEYNAELTDTLGFVGEHVVVKVTKAAESEPSQVSETVSDAPKVQGQSKATVTARFFVRPDDLEPHFAVLKHTGLPRKTKSAEKVLLTKTPAVDVAEEALDFYENTVLPGARTLGILVP